MFTLIQSFFSLLKRCFVRLFPTKKKVDVDTQQLFLPIVKPFPCLPINLNFQDEHYHLIHNEDFQFFEVTMTPLVYSYDDFLTDFHHYLYYAIQISLFRLHQVPYEVAHMNLHIYFNAKHFSNVSKSFYYKKRPMEDNANVYCFFLTQKKALFELYDITQILKVSIQIIYA